MGRCELTAIKGAGNSFLGGLSAGLLFGRGDMREGEANRDLRARLADHDCSGRPAVLYATISASFVIEQEGLPSLSIRKVIGPDGTGDSCSQVFELWNGDEPIRRLEELHARFAKRES